MSYETSRITCEGAMRTDTVPCSSSMGAPGFTSSVCGVLCMLVPSPGTATLSLSGPVGGVLRSPVSPISSFIPLPQLPQYSLTTCVVSLAYSCSAHIPRLLYGGSSTTQHKGPYDRSDATNKSEGAKHKWQNRYPDEHGIEQQDNAEDEAQCAKDAYAPSLSSKGHDKTYATTNDSLNT
jgi:hypothetical protein